MRNPSDLPLDPAEFGPRFAAAARQAGFAAKQYGEINGYPLLAYTKRTPGRRPRVYVSTGMHGDEPAPAVGAVASAGGRFF